jgi:hypothetical protein
MNKEENNSFIESEVAFARIYPNAWLRKNNLKILKVEFGMQDCYV